MKKTTSCQMWQRARTLLTHCKHTHTKQKPRTHRENSILTQCEYVRGTDLLYSSISQRQISISGNVRLIKMNVRWSKRRVKTSKRSAGSWINLGLNSLQTHLRQEFHYEPYQEWSKEMQWPQRVPMAHRWPTFPFVIPHISALCKTAGC